MKVRLGITDSEAIEKAARCMDLGTDTARVGDALAFAAYTLGENRVKNGGVVDVRDISAAFHSSAGAAQRVKGGWLKVTDPAADKMISGFIRAANKANKELQNRFISPPKGVEKEVFTEKHVEDLRKTTSTLLKKAFHAMDIIKTECNPSIANQATAKMLRKLNS